MGVFDFFRKTELDILKACVKGRILVVGPMGDYKNGDPTLPLLIKFLGVNPNQIVTIDNRGMNAWNTYILAGDKVPTAGDILETKQSMERLHKETAHYLISNALKLSFADGTFDTIIDRLTHFWIFENAKIPNPIKILINEYSRVLKKSGSVILFYSVLYTNVVDYNQIISEFSSLNYDIKCGSIKEQRDYKKGDESYHAAYPVNRYIVAVKTKD